MTFVEQGSMLRAVVTEGYPWNRGKRRRLFEAKRSILRDRSTPSGFPSGLRRRFYFLSLTLERESSSVKSRGQTSDKEGGFMKQLFCLLSGLALTLTPAVAFAEGATAYSRGNAVGYFAAIAAVLIFGIHDVFHKKWLTWTSAIVIPILLYLNLPPQ